MEMVYFLGKQQRRVLNGTSWGKDFFDHQSSINDVCRPVKATWRHLWVDLCQTLDCLGKPMRLEKSQLCFGP